jgi:hypothetical protein
MGNQGPCSCCDNNPTPRDSQFRINLILNSEQVSCLPSEIDPSNSKLRSNLESFSNSKDFSKFESFQYSRGSKVSNFHASHSSKDRKFSVDSKPKVNFKSRCLTPVSQCSKSKERVVPFISIDLSKRKRKK